MYNTTIVWYHKDFVSKNLSKINRKFLKLGNKMLATICNKEETME